MGNVPIHQLIAKTDKIKEHVENAENHQQKNKLICIRSVKGTREEHDEKGTREEHDEQKRSPVLYPLRSGRSGLGSTKTDSTCRGDRSHSTNIPTYADIVKSA